MNIHFLEEDEKLLTSLNNLTIESFIIGSHMYNLNNEKSDLDFLNIYLEPKSNLSSVLWEHHQLQYKRTLNNKNIDENYTTLQGFIRNILTGDATINFEILFSEDLDKSESLGWLYKYRKDFIGYNIIKSYLGLAKRDLKYYIKDTKNLKYHDEETDKKLFHFIRGVFSARMLLINNDLNLNYNGLLNNEIKKIIKNQNIKTEYDLLFAIKNNILFDKFIDNETKILIYHKLTNHFSTLMDNLRLKILKDKIESKSIFKYMNPIVLKEIDEQIKETYTLEINTDISEIDYGNLFYNVLENGVSY
jgi:predicted nucleotidyltransferase